jgi:hypothetical protein
MSVTKAKATPMLLNKIPSSLLITELKSLVDEERKLTVRILHYLKEIEARKLHLEAGFSSLFEYCVKELGYSEGSAHRRLSAMRLIRDLPETEKAIEEGRLSLTAAAQAQTYFREVAKTRGPILRQEKIAIIAQLEGCSTRECERALIALDPNPILPAEKTKPLSEEHTLIQFVADRALLAKLERLKGLLAHQNFSGDYAKLFNRLADLGLEKLGYGVSARRDSQKGKPGSPEAEKPGKAPITLNKPSNPNENEKDSQSADVKAGAQTNSGSNAQTPGPSRYLPAAVKREVWKRDGGRCVYVDPKAGRRCSSRHGLQFDHIHPHARGGEGSAQNLQLLCGAHNRYRAEKMGLRRRL